MPAVMNDKNTLDILPLFTKAHLHGRFGAGMDQEDYKKYRVSKVTKELL